MKNYLYILCTFLLAFAGCTKDADVEPIAPAPDENAQVVLTGFSGRGTRTGFGGAEDGAVPFLWSAGDYIWASNTRSEAIAEGGSQATFIFESIATADTYDVFYNLTGPAAATALIPAEQTQQAAGELNLGQNGDFGYAKAQNGTFTLEHATSYVWFDTYSSDVTSNLLSITLSVSGGQTIAGEAAFADGKLGDCKGSSSVTLSFGEEGVALPSQSNDTDVFAAMVLYPADLSTATVSIVYKFADGSVYLQTKSGKTLTPGHTLRLSTQIAKSDCKNSGAFFMTEAGVAEELPTEPIGYLKVVTLGESTLSAEELTSIAGNLANGAVIDLGEATFATTEFPMDFTRKTNLQEIALPRNIPGTSPSPTALFCDRSCCRHSPTPDRSKLRGVRPSKHYPSRKRSVSTATLAWQRSPRSRISGNSFRRSKPFQATCRSTTCRRSKAYWISRDALFLRTVRSTCVWSPRRD